jgi:hypothetical protein
MMRPCNVAAVLFYCGNGCCTGVDLKSSLYEYVDFDKKGRHGIVSEDVDAASEAALVEFHLGLSRAIGAVGVHVPLQCSEGHPTSGCRALKRWSHHSRGPACAERRH